MRMRMRGRESGHKTCYRQIIARARSVETQQITTNYISLPILHVSELMNNDVFNTDAHRQCN